MRVIMMMVLSVFLLLLLLLFLLMLLMLLMSWSLMLTMSMMMMLSDTHFKAESAGDWALEALRLWQQLYDVQG